jgi:threonine dehydrogenase-like Zn-dependent dehydrogenase
MRALTWQGNLNMQVTDVPDPRIQGSADAVIQVASTAICGSDLRLYGYSARTCRPATGW